jgi:hypothetical protein
MTKTGISVREFAKRDGCSRALIRRAISQGKLIAYDDGTIDAGLVGTAWRRRPKADDSGGHTGGGHSAHPTTPPFGESQARKEYWRAQLTQVEFEVRSGRLVDAEAVHKRIFRLAQEYKVSLEAWPAQVAPVIAAELGIDATRLAVLLDKHIRAFLTEHAASVRGRTSEASS